MKKRIVTLMLAATLLTLCFPLSTWAMTREERLGFNRAWHNSDASPEALEYYRRRPGWDYHPSGFSKISALTKEITKGISSDYDKVKAIHDWICTNISYDWDQFAQAWTPQAGSDADSDIFVSKRGICGSFSDLARAMLRAADIPARTVQGVMKDNEAAWAAVPLESDYRMLLATSNPAEHHTWTEAYVDGRWLIMDTTWDAAGKWENGGQTVSPGIKGYEWFDISIEEISKTRLIIEMSDFYGVAIYDDLLLRIGGNMSAYAVPDGVSRIDALACWFYDSWYSAGRKLSNPLASVTIPGSVRSIGDSAFSGVTTLKEVTIAEGLTTIENFAFANCASLKKITIPASVTSIGSKSFVNCKKLTIYGQKGSFAQTFAKKQKIRFVAVS